MSAADIAKREALDNLELSLRGAMIRIGPNESPESWRQAVWCLDAALKNARALALKAGASASELP